MSTPAPVPTRERPNGDGGFTLVELVVAVTILGFIAVALAGVVLSYLRNTVDTAARLTESHDVQFTAAYWQRDVASIGVRSATYDETPSVHSFPLQQSVDLPPECPLPAGTIAVVTLGWSEYNSLDSSGQPALVTVTYATRADGDVFELLRVRCGNQPSTIRVADSLAAVPTVACLNASGASTSCTGAGDDVPTRVELSLQALDSSEHDPATYEATLSGERRQS